MAMEKILIIDDSTKIRSFLSEVLCPLGYVVSMASDGKRGLDKALTERPDLILLDFHLPHLSGIEVLEALHKDHHEVPVILMTAHGSESVAVQAFRLGVRDYLTKPFEAKQILEVIEKALTESRLRQERDQLMRKLEQANRKLERRVVDLSTLYAIGQSVTSLLDLEKLLNRVVEASAYLTGADEAFLFLVEEGKDELYLRDSRGLSEKWAPGSRLKIQDTLMGTVITTGKPLALDSTTESQELKMLDHPVSALMNVPLKVKDKTIGVLGVTSKTPGRAFARDDLSGLAALADYAAIAIENAQLLRRVEQAKEREKKQIRGLFERYVAPSVVERLMARPETVELGGVRQQATILFADIRGFSDLSARASPEALVDVLNHHIAVAVEAILAEDGTLDKFLGDGVMAYFNAPLAQPDHVLRAVRAAWRLCRSLEDVHTRLPEASQVRFGVGVSTGEVIVGNIGAPQLMSFTVIGDAVNIGRRLQERARGGQILVTQQVYGLAQDYVKAEMAGLIEVKGHSQPEPVFEVVSVQLPEGAQGPVKE
jgi:class 3 adenylate cyclase/DNA-binding response OmpR family regulator